LVAFAALLTAVELRWGPLRRLDLRVADDLHRTELRHPGQVSWWKWVSRVLHPDVLRIAAALAALVLWLRRRRRDALLLAAAMAGAWLIETVTKPLVGRDRPVFAHPVAHAPGASFPSGHALTAIVAFGLVMMFVPRYRWVAAAVGGAAVILVAFSRLALGVHYLTDVVGAWLLGAAWLIACTWAFNRRRSPRAGVRPSPDRPR
jgi:undecaprenyl-diphosphatase